MTAARRPDTDRGFSLVEVVISVVLSTILAGVVTSLLITSLNVADRTDALSHDATDAGLVAAFLYRDAQAAGGTDLTTLAAAAGVGVSTADWGGCDQPGELVVRFAWVELSEARPTTVTWALDGDGELNRRQCRDGAFVDATVGQHVASATATCSPGPVCDHTATSVVLMLTGSSDPEPLDLVLEASLRPDDPDPLLMEGATTPLVVIEGGGVCPELTLVDGSLRVLGNALVDGGCAAVLGDPGRMTVDGQLSRAAGTLDPYAAAVPAAPDCPPPGTPVVDDLLVWPPEIHLEPVVIADTVVLDPGVHVFCQGLEIAPGGQLVGSDVLLQVAGGDVTIADDTYVELSAATSGTNAQLLLTVAAGDVVIGDGSHPTVLRGVIHAPAGVVTFDADVAAAVGAVVADRVAIVGPGVVRVGLPLPTVAVQPYELPDGQVGVGYPPLTMRASGGTGPYSWRATGLPAGLILRADGVLTGTPSTADTSAITVTATDSTGLVTVAERAIRVAPRLTVTPGILPDGTVGTGYSAAVSATGGTAPYTFSATGLPDGLAMSTDGTISGTPTTEGTSSVTVAVHDTVGTDAVTVTLTVQPSAPAPPRQPLAATAGFQVFVAGDTSLETRSVDGAVATGGDLTYLVGSDVARSSPSELVVHPDGEPLGLLVGGSVDLAGSSTRSRLDVDHGWFAVGDASGQSLLAYGDELHLVSAGVTDRSVMPRVVSYELQTRLDPTAAVAPGAFDFAGAFDELRTVSARLATLQSDACPAIANPTVRRWRDTYFVELTPGVVNVWNLTIADLRRMAKVDGNVVPDASTPLVINVVDGGEVSLHTRRWARRWSLLQDPASASSVLWNFPNAAQVSVTNSFDGTLLAPNAHVSVRNWHLRGTVVAGSLDFRPRNAEIAHFDASVPCLGG